MLRCSSDVADADVDSGDDPPLCPFFRMPLGIGGDAPPIVVLLLLPPPLPFPTLIVTRVPPFDAALMPLDCGGGVGGAGGATTTAAATGAAVGRLPIRFCETSIAVIFSTLDWVLCSDGREPAEPLAFAGPNSCPPFSVGADAGMLTGRVGGGGCWAFRRVAVAEAFVGC